MTGAIRVRGISLSAVVLVIACANPPLAASPTTSASAVPTASATAAVTAIKAIYAAPELGVAAAQNAVLPGSVKNDRGMKIGPGSDLWHGPTDAPDEFWIIGDRGPNGQISVGGANRRTFPVPEYTPLIMRVKAAGTTFQILQTIPVLAKPGKGVTGLPNIRGYDEVPYDYSAQTVLPYDPNGLDTEGLVRTRSGTFWLVEEYSPSLLRVGADGVVQKRYIPAGVKLTGTDYPVVEAFPAIYGKRKINRGFEGLTLSRDERTLYIVLQSPLSNPDGKTGDASRNTRILAFDIATEKLTAEWVYRLDVVDTFDPKSAGKPAEMKVSSLAWVNPTTLLVGERTDLVMMAYLADIGQATNILGSRWDDVATAPSLEAQAELPTGLTPMAKTLVVNVSALPGTPGKIEGLAIIDASTIAVISDNDFAIGDFDKDGMNVSSGVKTLLVVITLAKPLPLPPT